MQGRAAPGCMHKRMQLCTWLSAGETTCVPVPLQHVDTLEGRISDSRDNTVGFTSVMGTQGQIGPAVGAPSLMSRGSGTYPACIVIPEHSSSPTASVRAQSPCTAGLDLPPPLLSLLSLLPSPSSFQMERTSCSWLC